MNLKAKTLLYAFERLPKGSVIVEVGCVRFDHEVPSDGYSTVHLGERAKVKGWSVVTIDVDPQAAENARRLTSGLPVQVVEGDGATVIAGLDRIDGLFLDGSADPADSAKQYKAAQRCEPKIVVVDDAQPIDGRNMGKAADLLGQLLLDGYELDTLDTEPGYRMLIAS